MALPRFGRNKKKAALPRNARVVQRPRRDGSQDTGYWVGSYFYLLDGTACTDSDYTAYGDVVQSNQIESVLNNEGYTADTSGDTSNYSGGESYSSGDSGSSYSSGDSGSSYSGGGSSYDSGSSYSSGSSSSSYDSGSSSSSSDSGSSW